MYKICITIENRSWENVNSAGNVVLKNRIIKTVCLLTAVFCSGRNLRIDTEDYYYVLCISD